MTADVLQLLLTHGVPAPLCDLSTGSCAIVTDDRRVAVYDGAGGPLWTLSAAARWPESFAAGAHPWAALAPHPTGVVLLNMATCNIEALPDAVQMSLRMQQHRNCPTKTLRRTDHQFSVSCHPGELRLAGPTDSVRALPIGVPYTVTADAFARHEVRSFSYLSPSLRAVADVIAQSGPLSTTELAQRVYREPTRKDMAALHMTLSRLRQHRRVCLTRDNQGRLTISSREEAHESIAQSG